LPRNEMTLVKNMSVKLLVICFMLGFGLFFGMDIVHKRTSDSAATSIQRETPAPTSAPVKDKVEPNTTVIGPMTAANARIQAQAAQMKQQAQQGQTTQQGTQPLIVLEDSFVNRLSNALGDFFRHLASFFIHAIVAFFKLILG
jgi:hypothetical protein